MPNTSSVGASGNQDIDGLLTGVKWSTGGLTFSFPTSAAAYDYSFNGEVNTFGVLSGTAATAVRGILGMYASVANLSFTELTGSQNGQGDLRYADSDAPGTAWAYYPSTSSSGGDAWFHKSGTYGSYYDNPQRGNYGYLTYVHETGHALGLKHGQETDVYGALPSNHDSLEYSVMTYRSYVGGSTTGGYTNETWGYPQTLMQDDIAALQYMYGANFNYHNGNNVYTWSATTGEMFVDGVGQGAPGGDRIFMTVWDGGGVDTYDFSNYAVSLTVNLLPGAWTTLDPTQLANLGNGHIAAGNIANALLFQGNVASLIDNAIGGAAADHIYGNAIANVLDGRGGNDYLSGDAGNDTLIGGAGNDTLVGGANTDTAVFGGNFLQYTLHWNGSAWTIADNRGGAPDGTDTVSEVENYQFADHTATTLAHDGGGALTSASGPGWDVFIDTGNTQGWSSYTDTFNGSGQKVSEIGTFDDGSQWRNYWDADQTQIWSRYSEHWNSGQALTSQVGTFDDGQGWANNWDVDNTQNWSFYAEHYVAGGARSAQVGTFDDAQGWANYWDPDNTQIWSFYAEHYIVGGARSAQVGTFDDGQGWANYWDADGSQGWSFYAEHYIVGGARSAQVGTFDDGQGWANYWDADGSQIWSFYAEHYVVGGARSAQVGTYDNGAQWKNYWDPNNIEAWQSRSEYWNASGQLVNRVTLWDDGSQTTENFSGANTTATNQVAGTAPQQDNLAAPTTEHDYVLSDSHTQVLLSGAELLTGAKDYLFF